MKPYVKYDAYYTQTNTSLVEPTINNYILT